MLKMNITENIRQAFRKVREGRGREREVRKEELSEGGSAYVRLFNKFPKKIWLWL